jgi:hypothetical protein
MNITFAYTQKNAAIGVFAKDALLGVFEKSARVNRQP